MSKTDTYTVTMRCTNCLVARPITIPKGERAGLRVCPNCGVAAMCISESRPEPPATPGPAMPYRWPEPWDRIPPWRRPGRPTIWCKAGPWRATVQGPA